METIKVYSPIKDDNIKKELNGSPIWKQAYHEDEVVEAQKKHNIMFEYTVKFEGLTPVQVTKVKKIAN